MAALVYDVVIPTHGRNVELLMASVESVRTQTLPPRTIVIVVDAIEEVAQRIRTMWPTLVVLRIGPGAGPADARTAGVIASTSPWVCFVDDDDLWHHDKMLVTAQYLGAHPGCMAVRSTFWVFSTHSDHLSVLNELRVDMFGSTLVELEEAAIVRQPITPFEYLRIEGDSLGLLLERNRGVIGSTCVRRSILESIPAVPSGTRPGDDHVLFCLVATRAEWHLIDTPLLFYRLHPDQDTRQADPATSRRIIQSRIIAWQLCSDRAPRPLSTYGRTYRREFRPALWSLLIRGHVGEWVRTYRAATQLMPRWRDRVMVCVPEPLAWRWRHRWSPVARARVASSSAVSSA